MVHGHTAAEFSRFVEGSGPTAITCLKEGGQSRFVRKEEISVLISVIFSQELHHIFWSGHRRAARPV